MSKKSALFKKKRIRRVTPFIILVTILVWGFGLFWFTLSLETTQDISSLPKRDGIVVLTGGQGRIAAGIEALQNGLGKRLLISGVNPSLASETIFNAIGEDGALRDCCIDLGREALDTIGNAREGALWAANQNYKSFIVVTADYHMPRALVEFRPYEEQFQITHYSVETEVSFSTLALEYSKYLISLALYKFDLK